MEVPGGRVWSVEQRPSKICVYFQSNFFFFFSLFFYKEWFLYQETVKTQRKFNLVFIAYWEQSPQPGRGGEVGRGIMGSCLNLIPRDREIESLFLACMWRHHFLKSKNKEPPKFLSSSGNQPILNFRVMAVRDIRLRARLLKNIFLCHIF